MDNLTPNPLNTAIERVGSQVALASACGVTPQAVHQWVGKGKPPADKVLAIEAASGVSRHDLRPDIFGPAAEPGRAAA
jgi:DNA-binding transcriptional regulator YdaS (Cro superfamily)